MSELKMVNLILFLLSFHFHFIFIVFSTLNLELGVSMTSHITITNCHTSVTCHREHHRRF